MIHFLDTNRDGVISLDEWLEIGELLSRADARATYHNSIIEWLVRSSTKTHSKLSTRERGQSAMRPVTSLFGSGPLELQGQLFAPCACSRISRRIHHVHALRQTRIWWPSRISRRMCMCKN